MSENKSIEEKHGFRSGFVAVVGRPNAVAGRNTVNSRMFFNCGSASSVSLLGAEMMR